MNLISPHFFSFFTQIPLAEGFGFNTNIFETNIINLLAVLFVVYTFVGDNLTSLLNDRKKTIVNNLEEANQRALEAKAKLDQARNQLELAKKKAVEIREDGITRSSQELNSVADQHKSRLDRLAEFKQETITFYEQKSSKKSYSFVVSRVMSRVKERLNSGLDKISHITVNNFYVSRFTKFQ